MRGVDADAFFSGFAGVGPGMGPGLGPGLGGGGGGRPFSAAPQGLDTPARRTERGGAERGAARASPSRAYADALHAFRSDTAAKKGGSRNMSPSRRR